MKQRTLIQEACKSNRLSNDTVGFVLPCAHLARFNNHFCANNYYLRPAICISDKDRITNLRSKYLSRNIFINNSRGRLSVFPLAQISTDLLLRLLDRRMKNYKTGTCKCRN